MIWVDCFGGTRHVDWFGQFFLGRNGNNEAKSCMWTGMTRCSRMGLAMSCSICQTYSNLPMGPSGANACSWNEESPWTLRRSENCCSVICGHSSCTSTRRHTTACSQDGCYSIRKIIFSMKTSCGKPTNKRLFSGMALIPPKASNLGKLMILNDIDDHIYWLYHIEHMIIMNNF